MYIYSEERFPYWIKKYIEEKSFNIFMKVFGSRNAPGFQHKNKAIAYFRMSGRHHKDLSLEILKGFVLPPWLNDDYIIGSRDLLPWLIRYHRLTPDCEPIYFTSHRSNQAVVQYKYKVIEDSTDSTPLCIYAVYFKSLGFYWFGEYKNKKFVKQKVLLHHPKQENRILFTSLGLVPTILDYAYCHSQSSMQPQGNFEAPEYGSTRELPECPMDLGEKLLHNALSKGISKLDNKVMPEWKHLLDQMIISLVGRNLKPKPNYPVILSNYFHAYEQFCEIVQFMVLNQSFKEPKEDLNAIINNKMGLDSTISNTTFFAYAMTASTLLVGELLMNDNQKLSIASTSQKYYEIGEVVQNISRSYNHQVFHIDECFKKKFVPDILIIENKPSNAKAEHQYSYSAVNVLSTFLSHSRESSTLTCIIDTTFGAFEDQQVKDVYQTFLPVIRSGKLKLYLIMSLSKGFPLIGSDVGNGGLCVAIGKDMVTFKDMYKRDSYLVLREYMTFMIELNYDLYPEYLKQTTDNATYLRTHLEQYDLKFEIVRTTTPTQCIVLKHYKPDPCDPPGAKISYILAEHFKRIIAHWVSTPVRSSLGFPYTSITNIDNELIRFSVGLEQKCDLREIAYRICHLSHVFKYFRALLANSGLSRQKENALIKLSNNSAQGSKQAYYNHLSKFMKKLLEAFKPEKPEKGFGNVRYNILKQGQFIPLKEGLLTLTVTVKDSQEQDWKVYVDEKDSQEQDWKVYVGEKDSQEQDWNVCIDEKAFDLNPPQWMALRIAVEAGLSQYLNLNFVEQPDGNLKCVTLEADEPEGSGVVIDQIYPQRVEIVHEDHLQHSSVKFDNFCYSRQSLFIWFERYKEWHQLAHLSSLEIAQFYELVEQYEFTIEKRENDLYVHILPHPRYPNLGELPPVTAGVDQALEYMGKVPFGWAVQYIVPQAYRGVYVAKIQHKQKTHSPLVNRAFKSWFFEYWANWLGLSSVDQIASSAYERLQSMCEDSSLTYDIIECYCWLRSWIPSPKSGLVEASLFQDIGETSADDLCDILSKIHTADTYLQFNSDNLQAINEIEGFFSVEV